MINIGKIIRQGALVSSAVICCASPFVMREEGLRTTAYLDSVGVATICYGETEGVKLGDEKTAKECGEMFRVKLGAYAYAVQLLVERPMPVEVHAALTSWLYNVGVGAGSRSTLVQMARKGDFAGACDQLLRWKFAGGKPILLKRRERERELCLKGLTNA